MLFFHSPARSRRPRDKGQPCQTSLLRLVSGSGEWTFAREGAKARENIEKTPRRGKKSFWEIRLRTLSVTWVSVENLCLPQQWLRFWGVISWKRISSKKFHVELGLWGEFHEIVDEIFKHLNPLSRTLGIFFKWILRKVERFHWKVGRRNRFESENVSMKTSFV